MTQKTDPFINLNWGWDTGEGGWGEGMNENLIVHAFLQNKRIDGIIANASLLPASPTDGQAYFAEGDKAVYLRAESTWYTLLPSVGMTFILKTTEEVVKYNGTTLVSDTRSIEAIVGLQDELDDKVDLTSVGASNGVAPLGVDGKVPAGYLPASGSYLGTWDATTNTPTITSGSGASGEFYKVSVGGNVSIDGTNSWSIGDEIRFNGTVWQRVPNTSAVSSVNGEVGAVVLDYVDVGAAAASHTHAVVTTTVDGYMSAADKVKLNGIANGASANSSNATLLSRANHTGTQAQSTIVGLVADLAAKQVALVSEVNIKTINGESILGAGNIVISGGGGGSSSFLGLTDTPSSYATKGLQVARVNAGETAIEFVAVGSAAFANTTDFANSSHTHANATTSLAGFMSATDKVKVDGIATGATANQTDSYLLSRANHTGTQAQSTITNLTSDLAAKASLIAPIFQSPVTVNAAAGQSSIYFSQASVNNGRIYAGGGGGTDIIIDSGRFVTINPLTNFIIKFNNVDAYDFSPTAFKLPSGSKITGDFSNATINSRVLVQTNVANSVTRFDVIPNGTSTTATVGAFNNSDPTNASWARLTATATDTRVESTISGTGTYLPLVFYTGGSAKVILNANGNLLVNTGTDLGYRLDVNGNTRVAGDFTTNGNINVSKSAPVFNSIATGAAVGAMFNYLSFKDNSASEVGWMGYGNGNGEMGFNNASRNIRFLSPVVTNSTITTGAKVLSRFNAGATPSISNSHVELNNAASGNPVVLGFYAEGQSSSQLVHLAAGNGLELYNTSFGTYGNFKAATITATAGLNVTGETFSGRFISGLASSTAVLDNGFRVTDGATYNYGMCVPAPTGGLDFHSDQSGANSFRWYSGSFASPTLKMALQQSGNLELLVGNYIGNGSGLTNLPATSLTGTIDQARLPKGLAYSATIDTIVLRDGSANITANTFIGSGASLTNVNAQTLQNLVPANAATAGTIATRDGSNNIYAGGFVGSGASLTNLPAANLTGTIADARLSSNVALVSNVITKATPSQTTQTITHSSSGTLTINLALGTDVKINVSANITGVTFTNAPSTSEAWSVTLEFVVSGTRTIVWPSGSKYAGGTAPTLTANGTDVFVIRKRATDSYMVFTSGKAMA